MGRKAHKRGSPCTRLSGSPTAHPPPGQPSRKGAALAEHPGCTAEAHPCLQGGSLEGKEPAGPGVSTASNKVSMMLWDSHSPTGRPAPPTYSTAHRSMSERGPPGPPHLRERKAPDSSHITIWWHSEEQPDSWGQGAGYTLRPDLMSPLLGPTSSRIWSPILPIHSRHLWKVPTHSDFGLAQSLGICLLLGVLEEGMGASQAGENTAHGDS